MTIQILASAILLTLAAAPFGQWYLAWIALAPWLIAVSQSPTVWIAIKRGWFAGIIYFALNEWWLWTATIPGTIGVIVCSGFYWGLAAGVIHYLRLLSAVGRGDGAPPNDGAISQHFALIGRIVGIAVVWVAAEWLRCNTVSEFPWLPLGSTQSPLLVMCQLADFAGVWGCSFWVMLVNALVATAWLHRRDAGCLRVPCVAVAIMLFVIAVYGTWRLRTTPERAGPQIMLIQSNHPHVRGGASTTTPEEAVAFFLRELETHLAQNHADLVILPENEFPPLNDEARAALAPSPVGPLLEDHYRRLASIASQFDTALLVGGAAVTGWSTQSRQHTGSEIRNSAYFFAPAGEPVRRYDKIRLVPYSERLPFASGPGWLTDIALFLAASRAVQPLCPGNFDSFHPFILTYAESSTEPPAFAKSVGRVAVRTQAKFVTPICLENIDPLMCARMVRDPITGQKRADFFANLSNDGWFHDQEKYQHLQLLVFRCIENRTPIARSSNTGISAFIDSCGRVREIIGPNLTGFAVSRVDLDSRSTFYTNYGDVFPIACLIVVALVGTAALFESVRRMHAQNHATPARKRENSSV